MNKEKFQTFQSCKIERNIIMEGSYQDSIKQYIQKTISATKTSVEVSQPSKIDKENQNYEDLEDIWNSLNNETEQEQKPHNKIVYNKIDVVTELTEDQYASVFGNQAEDETINKKIGQVLIRKKDNIKQQQKIPRKSIQDLEDLWNNLSENQIQSQSQYSDQQLQESQKNVKQECKNEEQSEAETDIQAKSLESSSKSQNPRDLILEQAKKVNYSAFQKNLVLGRSYLIYDYKSFVIGNFRTKTYGYFGFEEVSRIRSEFRLFNIETNEPLLTCQSLTSREIQKWNLKQTVKGNKLQIDPTSFDSSTCLKFLLPNTKEHIATAFYKSMKRGILFNIKLYNSYQDCHTDTIAYIEIKDGQIADSCYCDTVVYLSSLEKEAYQKLKMIISYKNGTLIANMGINGIQSAPYNCRLQNNQQQFVFLLGMYDMKARQFVVRIGEGISPLISLMISVARLRYIDSFL